MQSQDSYSASACVLPTTSSWEDGARVLSPTELPGGQSRGTGPAPLWGSALGKMPPGRRVGKDGLKAREGAAG